MITANEREPGSSHVPLEAAAAAGSECVSTYGERTTRKRTRGNPPQNQEGRRSARGSSRVHGRPSADAEVASERVGQDEAAHADGVAQRAHNGRGECKDQLRLGHPTTHRRPRTGCGGSCTPL
eukprot:654486-Pleurochrysis_carterae.AAC.2